MGRLPSKEQFQKKLGKQIAKLRQAAGMTQDDLAERCGKEKQNISRIETGRTNPTAYSLVEIAASLEVPVKELFDFE